MLALYGREEAANELQTASPGPSATPAPGSFTAGAPTPASMTEIYVSPSRRSAPRSLSLTAFNHPLANGEDTRPAPSVTTPAIPNAVIQPVGRELLCAYRARPPRAVCRGPPRRHHSRIDLMYRSCPAGSVERNVSLGSREPCPSRRAAAETSGTSNARRTIDIRNVAFGSSRNLTVPPTRSSRGPTRSTTTPSASE